MTIKVAINGYGRIGRNILRSVYEYGQDDIEIVAINDLGDAKINAHLTRHDTVHGHFNGTVEIVDGDLVINGDRIKVLTERDPSKLPWAELGVDVVLECTGIFRTKAKCQPHIDAGAKKVIISAPADKNEADATIVFGVNDNILKATDTVISNASCTTNCLAPVVKPLNDQLGIVSGLMTTIHAYTNDQVLTDVYHKDLYRARAAALNMIPTKTGAAQCSGFGASGTERKAIRLRHPRSDPQRFGGRFDLRRRPRYHQRRSERHLERSFRRRIEGNSRVQCRTIGFQ